MNKHKLIYGFIALVITLGGLVLPFIQFETKLDTFSLASEKEKKDYQKLNSSFPTGEKSTIIILEHPEKWNSYEKFKRLQEATNWWSKRSTVKSVSSLSNLLYPRKGILGVKKNPFVPLESEKSFQRWYKKRNQFPDITGKFLSGDSQFTLLFVLPKNTSHLSTKDFKSFEKWCQSQSIRSYSINEKVLRSALKTSTQRDAILLATLSALAILLFFYWISKSLKGLGLIFLMITFNVSVVCLFLWINAIPFSVHMIAIPCLIIILSFTDIMHVLYHQYLLAPKTKSNTELRKELIRHVQLPMVLTSLTNMIGFAVFFLLSENIHLTNLSLVSIVGVSAAFLSSRFLVIQLMDKESSYIKPRNQKRFVGFHNQIIHRLQVNRKAIQFGAFASLIALGVIIGVFFNVDYSANSLLADQSTDVNPRQLLQKNFFGSKSAEIIIDTKGESIWTKEHLHQIEQTERFIDSLLHPITLSSPVTIAKRYNRYERNGHSGAYKLATNYSPSRQRKIREHYAELGGSSLVATGKSLYRVTFGWQDKGLNESLLVYQSIELYLDQVSKGKMQLNLTGKHVLSDRATHSFTWKIILGLLIGILFSSIMVWLFLRSMTKTIGMLMVNLLPMSIVLVLMLIGGIQINPMSLFFLSILLGVCVDDSIYIILQSKAEKPRLFIFPIFVTSVILIVGFQPLALSSFSWLRPYSWIFLVGIVFAYLFDVFVLPLFMNRNAKFEADD